MAKKKLTKKTGLSFLEKLLEIAGTVAVTILSNKTRGVAKPVELTDDQVKKMNDLVG